MSKTVVHPGFEAPSSHEMREEARTPAGGAMASTATATEKRPQSDPRHQKPQRSRRDEKFKVFCGTANPALAHEICDKLEIPIGQAHLTRFSDGEVYVQLQENVRGADVFIVQPTCTTVVN